MTRQRRWKLLTGGAAVLALATGSACGSSHKTTVGSAKDAGPHIVALDALSGKQQWSQAIDLGGAMVMSAGSDRVFVLGTVGCNPQGGGTLLALDSRNGHERWRTGIGTSFQSNPVTTFTPVGGVIIAPGAPAPSTLEVHKGNSTTVPIGSGVVRGLDAATGKERWKVPSSAQGQFAVADDTLVVTERNVEGSTSTATAYERATGKQRWKATVPNGELLGSKDALFVATVGAPLWFPNPSGPPPPPSYPTSAPSGTLVAIDIHTGKERWRTPSSGTPFGPKAVTNGVLVSADSPEVARLPNITAFDVITGKQRWTHQIAQNGGSSALTGVGNVVYSVTMDGYPGPPGPGPTSSQQPAMTVTATDASTGNPRWSVKAGWGTPAHPWPPMRQSSGLHRVGLRGRHWSCWTHTTVTSSGMRRQPPWRGWRSTASLSTWVRALGPRAAGLARKLLRGGASVRTHLA